MEVIKEEKKKEVSDVRLTAYRFGGVAMILLGLLWLCYNNAWLPNEVYDIIFSWQMGVMVAGGWLLATKNWLSGGIVVGIGAFCMLIDVFNIHISFTELVLPLALVGAGIACLFVKPTKVN